MQGCNIIQQEPIFIFTKNVKKSTQFGKNVIKSADHTESKDQMERETQNL